MCRHLNSEPEGREHGGGPFLFYRWETNRIQRGLRALVVEGRALSLKGGVGVPSDPGCGDLPNQRFANPLFLAVRARSFEI